MEGSTREIRMVEPELRCSSTGIYSICPLQVSYDSPVGVQPDHSFLHSFACFPMPPKRSPKARPILEKMKGRGIGGGKLDQEGHQRLEHSSVCERNRFLRTNLPQASLRSPPLQVQGGNAPMVDTWVLFCDHLKSCFLFESANWQVHVWVF